MIDSAPTPSQGPETTSSVRSFREVTIANYNLLPREDAERFLEEAWASFHEGGRKQDEALALAAEASTQIREAQAVIGMLSSHVRTLRRQS